MAASTDTILRLEQIRQLIRDPFFQIPDLTSQERWALRLLAHGRTMHAVIDQLHASRRTAYRIVARALVKLNRALDRPPGQEISIEDLTVLSFQLLEKAAGA